MSKASRFDIRVTQFLDDTVDLKSLNGRPGSTKILCLLDYCIAGNFHWCKYLYIKQKKFLHVITSYACYRQPGHTHAAHLPSDGTVWGAFSRFVSLLASIIMKVLMLTGLWVDSSKTWQNTGGIQSSHMKYTKICTIWKFPASAIR